MIDGIDLIKGDDDIDCVKANKNKEQEQMNGRRTKQ